MKKIVLKNNLKYLLLIPCYSFGVSESDLNDAVKKIRVFHEKSSLIKLDDKYSKKYLSCAIRYSYDKGNSALEKRNLETELMARLLGQARYTEYKTFFSSQVVYNGQTAFLRALKSLTKYFLDKLKRDDREERFRIRISYCDIAMIIIKLNEDLTLPWEFRRYDPPDNNFNLAELAVEMCLNHIKSIGMDAFQIFLYACFMTEFMPKLNVVFEGHSLNCWMAAATLIEIRKLRGTAGDALYTPIEPNTTPRIPTLPAAAASQTVSETQDPSGSAPTPD